MRKKIWLRIKMAFNLFRYDHIVVMHVQSPQLRKLLGGEPYDAEIEWIGADELIAFLMLKEAAGVKDDTDMLLLKAQMLAKIEPEV